MRGLLILIPAFPWVNPNLDVLLPALSANRVDFSVAALDFLRLADGVLEAPQAAGDFVALHEYRLVWVLGFGTRNNFLDKLQLLKLAAEQVRFVNSPDAFAYLHANIT